MNSNLSTVCSCFTGVKGWRPRETLDRMGALALDLCRPPLSTFGNLLPTPREQSCIVGTDERDA
jgi:hypothetical protein